MFNRKECKCRYICSEGKGSCSEKSRPVFKWCAYFWGHEMIFLVDATSGSCPKIGYIDVTQLVDFSHHL